MKENKAQYVKRERDLMSNLDHPFFVKLYFTFQDDEKLCILLTSSTCRGMLCIVNLFFVFVCSFFIYAVITNN